MEESPTLFVLFRFLYGRDSMYLPSKLRYPIGIAQILYTLKNFKARKVMDHFRVALTGAGIDFFSILRIA